MVVHICGCYYYPHKFHHHQEPKYLPRVHLKTHTTILSTTSRTTLSQIFVNSTGEKLKELKYAFPLYDGVSVVGFTCHVGDRTITGVVKEKETARKTYDAAVARGETAGLLEQEPAASDVFTTTLGNIPINAVIKVEVVYLGELKHDAEVDGVRFTIPTSIAPRYGSLSEQMAKATQIHPSSGIEIVIDATMPEGSAIREMRSPSHPIAVSMGATSTSPNADPTMSKASATLSLGSVMLESDFVLQIVAKDTGIPKALVETHPTIKNHRALLATLVPKFSLPSDKPEIVFVCDRSGSMGGQNKIPMVKSALKVFLKSLPLGVRFNICSFGSRYSFLWSKSKVYSKETLDQATKHVNTFSADYGGTEMLEPIQATINQRYKDIALNVLLLTDGEIWAQDALFSYLNREVGESRKPIRVFTLGVGNDVSHSLIEGVARAGNGFSQAVMDGEKLDAKVVRMLKGALSPHINDYTLEVKYGRDEVDSEEDDFELVEKVSDCLKIDVDAKEASPTKEAKTISLFDTSTDPDKPLNNDEEPFQDLPVVSRPKLLQAPHRIPPLFPFNRTSVYLLMSPESSRKKPVSVVLRATSAHGPLELEIPVETLPEPGETIHQLAAKKAVAELEQGRGWITDAKDQSGKLLKDKFDSKYEDMVRREAVDLGVQFQVGGKWCSFVAVEGNGKNGESVEAPPACQASEPIFQQPSNVSFLAAPPPPPLAAPMCRSRRISPASPILSEGDRLQFSRESLISLGGQAPPLSKEKRGGLFSLFGSSSKPSAPARSARPGGASLTGAMGAFGSSNGSPPGAGATSAERFARASGAYGGGSKASPTSAAGRKPVEDERKGRVASSAAADLSKTSAEGAVKRAKKSENNLLPNAPKPTNQQPTDLLGALISMQTFEGFWEYTDALLNLVGVSKTRKPTKVECQREAILATALAIAFFKKKLAAEEDSWELVIEKASGWLREQLGGSANVETLVEEVEGWY